MDWLQRTEVHHQPRATHPVVPNAALDDSTVESWVLVRRRLHDESLRTLLSHRTLTRADPFQGLQPKGRVKRLRIRSRDARMRWLHWPMENGMVGHQGDGMLDSVCPQRGQRRKPGVEHSGTPGQRANERAHRKVRTHIA